MKAHLFLPAFLLIFGAGAANPADAQELSLTLGAERGQVSLALSKGGVRASTATDRRGRSYGRDYRSGRSIRVDFRNQRHVCRTTQVWIPGHFETRPRQVFVPGHREKVWIEPAYETAIDDCGRRTRFLVRAGYWDVIEHPGHYETHHERVWIAGRFEHRRCCSR